MGPVGNQTALPSGAAGVLPPAESVVPDLVQPSTFKRCKEANAALQSQAANTRSERSATEKEKADLLRQLRVADEGRAATEADIVARHSCTVKH